MRNLVVVLGLLSFGTLVNAAAIDCTTAPAIGSNVLSLNPMGCFGGGLLFDTFSVSSAPPGTTVFLSAIGTGPVGSPQGFSLGFQITAPNPPVDTILQYRVTAQAGFSIIDVDNAQNGVNTRIGEVVCSVAFVSGVCPTGNVLANFANPPTTMPPAFAPQSVVYILKDVSEPSTNSFISSFVNSHETSGVPEPATLLLLGMGLVGIASLSRKTRR